jgi:photosystem II stability/assembly factor-like uncharacterized protein
VREFKDERLQARARAFGARPATIVSPDPNVQWRLSGRTVERSADAGRTWQMQPTGADADLLAGAAPSASVCWLVGGRGLVLVSTDGATWRRVNFPDRTADLAGVTATSALVAAVTSASGRTYRTSDGGVTWTPQENPAPPF